MNEPNDELARRIARHLDFSADHVSPSTRERLLEARKHALSRFQEPARGYAWAGGALARWGDHHFLAPRYLIAAAALVAALGGIAWWQSLQNGSSIANELAEIDAGLLTDELPINAYLDKGFDSWLKRSSR